MANTISPNMNLIVPSVGNESGPQYATDINNSLALIDSHDHSPGKGVKITPAGMNINATLTFNSNAATNLLYTSYTAESSPSTALQSISVAPVSGIDELFYTDSNGTTTQITTNGKVDATIATIAGLSYNATTNSWSFTDPVSPYYPSNLYIANLYLQTTTGTYNTEIVPPTSGSYQITLPVPMAEGYSGMPNFLNMNPSGQIVNTYYLDNTTLNASGNVIQVKPGGIGPTQLSAAALSEFTTWNVQDLDSNGTWTAPTGVNQIFILGWGGGSGGGGGAAYSATNGPAPGGVVSGGGGYGSSPSLVTVPVTPGTTYNVIIGAGGAGGTGGVTTRLPANGNDGSIGSDSLFVLNGTTFTGTTTNGSNVITSVSSVAGLAVGQIVNGTNLPANSVIAIVGSTTVTLLQNATGSASGTVFTPATLLARFQGAQTVGAGGPAVTTDGGFTGSPGTDVYAAAGGQTAGGGGGGATTTQTGAGANGNNSNYASGGLGGTSSAGTLGIPAAGAGGGGAGYGEGGNGANGYTSGSTANNGSSGTANSGAGGGGGGMIYYNAVGTVTGGTGGAGGSGGLILYWLGAA